MRRRMAGGNKYHSNRRKAKLFVTYSWEQQRVRQSPTGPVVGDKVTASWGWTE